MMEKTKFKIGDKVKIVNYGSLQFVDKETYYKTSAYFVSREKYLFNKLLTGNETLPEIIIDRSIKPKNLICEKDGIFYIDMSPELVGQEGIIQEATITQNIHMYSIDGIKGKSSWYHNDQLELINANPNTL